jgi:hypothetical protein
MWHERSTFAVWTAAFVSSRVLEWEEVLNVAIARADAELLKRALDQLPGAPETRGSLR